MNAPESRNSLALFGGLPLRRRPFAPWPSYAEDEIEAATAVLRSGKVNQWTGTHVTSFETEYAASLNREYAVAVANGTVALELALIVLGIGPGDEVIVPARTFVATASCVALRGATPIVADVDEATGGLSAATVQAALTPRTRAVIPVHLGGWPCDMDPLRALADQHGFAIIEDCAQAHGATYRGRPVGSLGHLAAFSFCQDKIITTGGEGGLLVMDREDWWSRAWSYKDHGKDFEAVQRPEPITGFRWVHHSFGTNWRMTEFQAAIGRLQLAKLDAWVGKRRMLAARLKEQLSGVPALTIPRPGPDAEPSFYRFYARLDVRRLREGWDQQKVIDAIAAEGIPCQAGSCSEIYREQAFQKAGLGPSAPLPVARRLGEESLMFYVHPTLTVQDMDDTAAAVRKVLAAAAG